MSEPTARPQGSVAGLRRPLRSVIAGLVAAAVIMVWGLSSSVLPELPMRLNIMASSALVLSSVAVLVWSFLPGQALGRRLPLVTVVALPLAALFVWLGWIPFANLAKIVAAAALGIWIAAEIERLSWVVIVAVVSALVDIVSVAAGPTKALLDQGPVVIGYFTVAVTWMGCSYREAYTALGVSDVIFLALYLGTAYRFGLRAGWSAAAMVASFLITIAAAMWWTALPALPLLAVAFLAVNADLIWERLRGDARPG